MAKIPDLHGKVRIESDGSGKGTRVLVMVNDEPVDISHLVVSVRWELSKQTHRLGAVTLELLPGAVDIQGKLRALIEPAQEKAAFIEASDTVKAAHEQSQQLGGFLL